MDSVTLAEKGMDSDTAERGSLRTDRQVIDLRDQGIKGSSDRLQEPPRTARMYKFLFFWIASPPPSLKLTYHASCGPFAKVEDDQ
jgi:hypothetical protein